MKNLILIVFLIAALSSCSQDNSTTEEQTVEGRYGDTTWIAESAWTTDALIDSLVSKDSVYGIVKGDIKAACQAKGCWMSMDAGEQELFVKFKDYGFFVPKNSGGYGATMRGWAYVDTVSVADQIERIKDSDKSEEEMEEAIALVSEPEVKLSFLADGVIIE